MTDSRRPFSGMIADHVSEAYARAVKEGYRGTFAQWHAERDRSGDMPVHPTCNFCPGH